MVAIAGLAIAAVGVGVSVKGSIDAKNANKDIANAQMQQNALAEQQMELDAKRKQMETLRQQQRTRALGLTRAANQGAMFGSGLQGAYGQIQGEGDNNLNAIRESLGLGQQNFALSNQISGYKSNLADAQSLMQIGGSLTSLGGAVISNAGTINKFGSQYVAPYMSFGTGPGAYPNAMPGSPGGNY